MRVEHGRTDRRGGARGGASWSGAWGLVLAAIGAALLVGDVARAAELQLRPECRASGPVVTLGDVADVLSSDSTESERLAAMELFPAPPSGTRRYLRVRELQDMLLARGVDLLEHRMCGASQVVVLAAEADDGAVEDADDEAVPTGVMERAARRIEAAVTRFLQARVSPTERWTVEVQADPACARAVASEAGQLTVDGGAPPWLGAQRFGVTVERPRAPVRFEVDAEVSLARQRVVAARSLVRGKIIRASDVRLAPVGAMEEESEGFGSIDEVVGKQTTRAVPEGRVLDAGSLRQPLLVRRGEMITVYARSAGLRVRTTAKAREDGSLGDLIQVESPVDRAAYFARVSGIQEVEVYARPTQAERSGTAAPGGSSLGVGSRDGSEEPWDRGVRRAGGVRATGLWRDAGQSVRSAGFSQSPRAVNPEP